MDAVLSHPWQVQFPPLQAHDGGWLDVGDGHAVRWDVAGHPAAPAVLVLHGGPGAGCAPADRRWFDPTRWRIVTLDQRGSGRSRARQPLRANTTALLVDDIEALRRHLAVERWVLFGGSWGSTLALAYAQCHPQRVAGLVLRGVFTATRAETAWLYGTDGAALRCPAAWQRLLDAAGAASGDDVLEALHARLGGDGAQALAAAHAWCRWEHDLIDAEAATPMPPAAAGGVGIDDHAALGQARVGLHYARADWFLAEGELLAHAARLRGIAGVIVQGARDLVTPPAAARALHAAWPESTLHVVAGAGHASGHPAIARTLITALQAGAPAIKTEETNHG